MLSLITTLSRLKILLSILYMGEMEKWIIFKEIIISLNLFLVYTFFNRIPLCFNNITYSMQALLV